MYEHSGHLRLCMYECSLISIEPISLHFSKASMYAHEIMGYISYMCDMYPKYNMC